MTEIFRQGVQDWNEGKHADSNPFVFGTPEYVMWHTGWRFNEAVNPRFVLNKSKWRPSTKDKVEVFMEMRRVFQV